MKKEYRIGLTFLASLIILFLVIKFLSNDQVYSAGQQKIKVLFDDIGGLGPGDPVYVFGMKKGRVDNLNLLSKGVRVTIAVEGDVKIYEDGYAAINMKDLMGGKKIDLVPGSNHYEKTDSIRGVSAMDISQVMSKFGRVFADMSDQNLAFTIASFSNLSLKLAMIIESINPKNLRATMDGVDLIIQDFNKKKVVEQVSETINNFNKVAKGLDGGIKMLDSLPVTTKQVFDGMHKMLNEIESTMEIARNSLSAMNTVMGKVMDKETTAGKFINDKEFARKLDSLLMKVEQTLDVVRKNRMVVGVRMGKAKEDK
ncbi:MAG: hypothetical protein A3G23_09350 [Bacteroidetes bacterium RIFCSPLOWO2_12_FULL_37_12]|nr:MAG: hypothetical protein A3G23_09350 [Bacteroidetes bacterium RIFCSPLOWO2_12_FULL_37_12]